MREIIVGQTEIEVGNSEEVAKRPGVNEYAAKDGWKEEDPDGPDDIPDIGGQRIETRSTTSWIFLVEENGEKRVKKVVRKTSRLMLNAPKVDKTDESINKFKEYLDKKIKFLISYQEVIKELFGEYVVESKYEVMETPRGSYVIVETQDLVEGRLSVILGGENQDEHISYDYDGRGNKPYGRLSKEDPRYSRILGQLREINEICNMIRSSEDRFIENIKTKINSKGFEKIKDFVQNNPLYLQFQIDVHRLGNILMDSGGNARIIDW